MFSPLLIKISFATISSVGVALGGYFVYKKASSKKAEDSSVLNPKVDGSTQPPPSAKPAVVTGPVSTTIAPTQAFIIPGVIDNIFRF